MSQKILNHCEGIPAAVQSDSATWVSRDAVYKWPVEVPIQQPKKWTKTSCMHCLYKGDKLRTCAKQNQTQIHTHTKKKKKNLENDANLFQIWHREIEVEVFFFWACGVRGKKSNYYMCETWVAAQPMLKTEAAVL